MAIIEYPWYVFAAGDWYLRSIIVNATGIEQVTIYTAADYAANPTTPAASKTFTPPFSGKRINFDLRTPFVKIRVVFQGENLKILDMYYNAVEKRTS